MIIDDITKRERILRKLNTFFNLELYTDRLFLDSDIFLEKHGYLGSSFQNFFTVRFEKEPGIIKDICSFLPEADYYVMTLEQGRHEVYCFSRQAMVEFLESKNCQNFIILETALTWLMVYDRHRNLTGLGNYIKKKMKQNVHQRFGNSRLMFSTYRVV